MCAAKLEPVGDRPAVYEVNGVRVMLDADVATAFGTETKRVNEAVSRNPEKFDATHAWRLEPEEVDALRSQSATPNDQPKRRGGNQYRPQVFTLHGVARLATILNTPEALRATDLIISTFLSVYEQLSAGKKKIAIANPDDFEATDADRKASRKFKNRLLRAMNGLLDTMVGSEDETASQAAAKAARQLGGASFENVVQRLRSQGLKNEKLEADTALVLAQAEQVLAAARKTNAQADSIDLDNLQKKIGIVKQLMELNRDLEPIAFVEALDVLETDTPKKLSAPKKAKRISAPRKDKKD